VGRLVFRRVLLWNWKQKLFVARSYIHPNRSLALSRCSTINEQGLWYDEIQDRRDGDKGQGRRRHDPRYLHDDERRAMLRGRE